MAVAASFASMQKFNLDLRLMIVKVFLFRVSHVFLRAFKVDSWDTDVGAGVRLLNE